MLSQQELLDEASRILGSGMLESWNPFQSNGMNERKCYSHASAPSDDERLKRNRREAFKKR